MPNNIDMGGFGTPGLPLRQGVNGTLAVDSGIDGTRRVTVGQSGVRLGYLPSLPAGVSNGSAQLAFVPAFGNTIGFTIGLGGSALNICDVTANTSATVLRNGYIDFASNGALRWTNGVNNPTTTIDLFLERDAAGVLCQRNGTNAQAARIYGTYTDASNYVRASLAATSTAVTLAAQTAGTGADDVPVVLTPAGTSQVEVGNGVQFTEMAAPSAPAANKVILFAQDNGAGKTQLMALFPSGAAQQVAIEP